MKKSIYLLLLLITYQTAESQTIPVEVMPGHQYLNYQHLVHRKMSEQSRFGWTHITNMVRRYQTNQLKGGRANEIMNQVYVTMGLNKRFTIMSGFFYTPATNMKVSFATQFMHQRKDIFLILTPRFDVGENYSYEFFGLLEYSPILSKTIRWYSRFQFMTNHGSQGHNRSYQQIRLGLNKQSTQFGIGLTIDQYGPKTEITNNIGLFIRRLL